MLSINFAVNVCLNGVSNSELMLTTGMFNAGTAGHL